MLLHESFQCVYIRKIPELGLEVPCYAIKRFELQAILDS